jgi:hypothetical protein
MALLAEKPYDVERVPRNVKIRLIQLFLKGLFCQLRVTLYPDFINFPNGRADHKPEQVQKIDQQVQACGHE